MGYIIVVLILSIVGIVLWKITGTAALNLRRDEDQHRALAVHSFVGFAVPTLVAIITVWNMFYQVPAGHVGLVYTFGGITGQRGDGLQWVAPWQSVTEASVQIQSRKFEKMSSFSSETQEVFVDATINVQVSPQYIQNLYREVGPEYFDILVRPRVLQAFKDETVKYTSVDVAPNREAIRKSVSRRLTEELKGNSITVQDLLLDNIAFTPKFQGSIEEKQSQTQLALSERAKVEGEKAKADQAIEAARGTAQSILVNAEKQAEANRKLSASITPEYIQYLFADKLAPNVQVMMIPSGQQFIMGPDMLKRAPAAK
jgi:regulator of protease activity HflC (stomatin/prohibitin superfamily)